MTVREFIALLAKFDLELEVRTIRQDWHDPIEERDVFLVEAGQGAEFPHLLIT